MADRAELTPFTATTAAATAAAHATSATTAPAAPSSSAPALAGRTSAATRFERPRAAVVSRPSSGRERATAVVARVALPVALLLWLLSLRTVDLTRMGDLGLLQVLPALYWVAVAVLATGFALALIGRRVRTGWLAGYAFSLIAVIHATPALLYANLRYSWSWKHVEVIDAMLRHGGAVPHAGELGIYNQWPGFFALNALFLHATGLHSALGYAAWTPPVVNALLLGPLLLLYRAFTRDRRLVWGGIWIFYCCSWVGQDYFSPQAFTFLLYVVVLALVFRQLAGRQLSLRRKSRKRGDRTAGDAPGGAASGASSSGAASRTGVGPAARGWSWPGLLTVLLIEAVIVVSHQLTPLMLVTALAALSFPRANRRITLPPLLGLLAMVLLWGGTVARPFIAANLKSFGAALLTPDGNVLSGFAGLGAAAPSQVVVDWIDRGLSAAVFLLAVACFVRRPWIRRSGVPLAVVAPLPLLAANNYGGEMIFRVYLFALPASAFMIAVLILHPGPRRALRAVGAYVLVLALLGSLFFGYYSKEAANYFTNDEVAAARYATDSPPGSVVVTLTGAVPGSQAHYDSHTLLELNQYPPDFEASLVADPLAAFKDAVASAGPDARVYLLLNRAQAEEARLTGVLPANTQATLIKQVEASPDFTTVFRSPNAVVFLYHPPAAGSEGSR